MLNGKKHTTYAASWTLVNAHELAVISGTAAAYQLGAEYPKELEEDSFALLCFRCACLDGVERRELMVSLRSISFALARNDLQEGQEPGQQVSGSLTHVSALTYD